MGVVPGQGAPVPDIQLGEEVEKRLHDFRIIKFFIQPVEKFYRVGVVLIGDFEVALPSVLWGAVQRVHVVACYPDAIVDIEFDFFRVLVVELFRFESRPRV